MDNGVLIGLAMLLGGTLLGVANLKWRGWKGGRESARQGPRPLSALISCEFNYFPGIPQGYVGYTDYTAMNVVLNDDLIGRIADEQFMLIGFGEGFSATLLERVAREGLANRCTFRLNAASESDMHCVGWLSFMQTKGTDNAPPSTGNLQRVIAKVSKDLAASGPATMKFWHKVHSREVETPKGSETSPDKLNLLLAQLEQAKLRGARLAVAATLLLEN